jgi:hypothetical protein
VVREFNEHKLLDFEFYLAYGIQQLIPKILISGVYDLTKYADLILLRKPSVKY